MSNYYVYVIELHEEVLEIKKFLECNPDYQEGKACFYVGQTGKTPRDRYMEHMKGIKFRYNRYVYKYGIRLVPELYNALNPLDSREAAEEAEEKLAKDLQRQGHAVWWN